MMPTAWSNTPEGSAPKRWTLHGNGDDFPPHVCEGPRVEDEAHLVVVPESALREAEDHEGCDKIYEELRADALATQQRLAEAEAEALRSGLAHAEVLIKLAEAEAEAAQWKRLFRTLEDLREREKAKP